MIATINYPEGNGKQFHMFRYPGGEVQVRLDANQTLVLMGIREVHVIARITDGEIMGLAQLIDAIRGITPHPIKLILPYLPYARADRRFTRGDCFGLSAFARMLGILGCDIITLDVHSKEAAVRIPRFTDVSPKPIIKGVIDSLKKEGAVGILLPDAGAERYEIGTNLHAHKVRDTVTGNLIGFAVPPKEAFTGLDSVLIIDDICDGGGTFIGIADAIKDYGLDLYLYVTHGIFSKGFDELKKRFKKIYTTDSFPPSSHLEYDKVVIIPCMGTILDRIVDRPALNNSMPKGGWIRSPYDER